MNILIETITYIAFFAVGWALGSKVTRAILERVFSEILKDLNIGPDNLKPLAAKYNMKMTKIEKDEETNEDLEVVEVKIEEHQGSLYAFRKDNDKFLGQGHNREELIDRIAHEFSGTVKMVVSKEDGADLINQNS